MNNTFKFRVTFSFLKSLETARLWFKTQLNFFMVLALANVTKVENHWYKEWNRQKEKIKDYFYKAK